MTRGTRAALAAFGTASVLALALGAVPVAPVRAQPVLHLPTPEPTPDPSKTLPPLPTFLGGYTAPPSDPLAYDDAGMHFRPPDGWVKYTVQPGAAGGASSDDLTPLVAFSRVVDKNDSYVIVIATTPFDGSLDAFESQTESKARQGSDTVFIGFHRKTALANGMPAYFLKINTGAVDAGLSATHFEYVIADGYRGIVASYASRTGDADENEAKKALASLTVVVYPKGRR